MTNKFKIALTGLLLLPAIANAQEDKYAKLEERIAELEAQQSLNIFSFGGLLETRYDSLKTKQTAPAASAIDDQVDYLRIRASLDAKAEVSKYINFYSRFTSTKYSNVFYTQNVGSGTMVNTSEDLSVAKAENGAGLYVEKFYADVAVPDSGFVFSFGRLPTSDGPPFNEPNGRPRSGTYPGLLYNTELDGLAMTYNTAAGNGNLSVRLVHSPFTRKASGSGTITGQGIVASPTDSGAGTKANTLSNLDTLMLEYTNTNLGWTSNFVAIAQAYVVDFSLDGSLMTLAAAGGTASGKIKTDIGAQALYLGAENILNSGLDLSVTHLMSKVSNTGCILFPGAAGSCSDATIATGAAIAGFGASSRDQSLSGNSTLLTARYAVANSTYVGTEYLMGGKNVFVYDANSDNLTGFYNTPGTGKHFYVLHKFTSELGLRLGTMSQEYKSTTFSFGPSKDTDKTSTTYYANIRLDF